MCGASEQGSLAEEECIQKRPLNDPEYFLEPFLEDKFEPFEWTHILATLSICTNKLTQTQFCDKEGNDIVPLCMVNGNFQKQSNSNFEETIPETKKSPINHIHNNEISTWDKESSEEETKQKSYD